MKILYLGLDPARFPHEGELVHLPLIQISPRPFEGEIVTHFSKLSHFSHVILTSRVAAALFLEYSQKAGFPASSLANKHFVCVGKATAAVLQDEHIPMERFHVAHDERAEGVVQLIGELEKRTFFYPHSAQARPLIRRSLQGEHVLAFPLYDTLFRDVNLPPLDEFDRFVFTSPSTVKAFAALSKKFPPLEKCVCQGPITYHCLIHFLRR